MLSELAEQAWSCINKISNLTTPKDDGSWSSKLRRRGMVADSTSPDSQVENSATNSLGPPNGEMNSATVNQHDLDMAFSDLLRELNLDPGRESRLWKQPAEVKWLMLVEQHARNGNNIGNVLCDSLIRKLEGRTRVPPDKYSMPLVIQHLEALAISLRTECVSFVQRFIDSDGIELLVGLLNQSQAVAGGDSLAAPILNCFKALLNTEIGRSHITGSGSSSAILLSITGTLDFNSARCKPLKKELQIFALEILSGVCLLLPEQGNQVVLKALTDAALSGLFGERTRFQKIVDDLHRECGQTSRERERARIALMSLVNSLLKTGPSELSSGRVHRKSPENGRPLIEIVQDDEHLVETFVKKQSLEFRLHLRYEFLMLGIQEVIDKLRGVHGATLEDHFDLFEMMRQEDEQEMNGSVDSGSSSPVDIESPAGMAEALSHKLDSTLALPHFISLLQHMLMIPGDGAHLHLWRLFDLIVQQLSLHTALGDFSKADPQLDSPPLQLDVDELISRLKTSHECDRLQKQLTEATLELENERRRVVELENKLSDIQDGFSLSSFSRISDLSSSPSDPCHSPTFGNSAHRTRPGDLPPIRPPTSVAPPPPPPSARQLRSGSGAIIKAKVEVVKKVPKPPGPLRTLNWTVVPPPQIAGTIWEKLDDERLYQHIDLQEINQLFFAGKGSGEEGEGNTTLLRKLRRTEPTLISVIDSRRAQNCTIMLSKLRLCNKEIRQTIWNMDERARLPKDMIEQMLKFVPTKEELILLRETLNKHKSPAVLAMADRYLLEVGQIPRFEQRLRCLHTIKTFKERLDELLPYFNSVVRASTAVNGSKKLKQLMALVLAIGNYLNYGKRSVGNAQGFHVHSLDSIHQVKSAMRTDRNLMHFISYTVETNFPELLRLKKELACVYEASKYNRTEMEVEFRLIESSLRDLANELAVVRSSQQRLQADSGCASASTSETSSVQSAENPKRPTSSYKSLHSACKFVPVVTAFLETSRKLFKDAQNLHFEMDEKFTKCARYFAADDPKDSTAKCSPDEFFGSFAKCLNQLGECCQTLWDERAEAERTKRQTLTRQMLSKKNGKRKGNGKNDFDGLMSALQSCEIFSDDLSRLRASIRFPANKQSHKQNTNNNNSKTNGNIITVNVDSAMRVQ